LVCSASAINFKLTFSTAATAAIQS
jgi:hypothetical protein